MDTFKENIEIKGFEYVNGLINERNFPKRNVRANVTHIPVPEGMTLREAEAWAIGEGFEMAHLRELIEYSRIPGHVYALADVLEYEYSRVPLASLENGVYSLSIGFYDGSLTGDDFMLVVKKN